MYRVSRGITRNYKKATIPFKYSLLTSHITMGKAKKSTRASGLKRPPPPHSPDAEMLEIFENRTTSPSDQTIDSEDPHTIPDDNSGEDQHTNEEIVPKKTLRPKPKNSYSLSSEIEEELVFEFIRENQLLWNSKTKDFSNKAKKDRLWQGKAAELGYTGELIGPTIFFV